MFKEYADAGFGSEILPIIPPDAEICTASPAYASLVKGRGKIPGKRRHDGWQGFGKWTEHQATVDNHRVWGTWGAGLGIQGRLFPAIDIDVDDNGVADAIENEAAFTLGVGPCRYGNGARRLLVYSGEGLRKARLSFRIPGGTDVAPPAGVRVGGDPDPGGVGQPDPGGGAGGAVQAVEFLATGQHYVAEGIHPKTRSAYWWRDEVSPVTVGAAGLTVITAEDVEAFFDRVEQLVVAAGGEILTRAAGGGGAGHGGPAGTAGLVEHLRAPSLAAVEAALAAIPNEGDLDYDDWIRVGAMVRGATEGFEA